MGATDIFWVKWERWALSVLLKTRQRAQNGVTYAKSRMSPNQDLITVLALPEMDLTPVSQELPGQH